MNSIEIYTDALFARTCQPGFVAAHPQVITVTGLLQTRTGTPDRRQAVKTEELHESEGGRALTGTSAFCCAREAAEALPARLGDPSSPSKEDDSSGSEDEEQRAEERCGPAKTWREGDDVA